MTWDVHTGKPSWHQQRAGHISSSVMGGFATKAAAEEYARKFKEHHPDEPAIVLPAPEPRAAVAPKRRRKSRFGR